MNTNKNINYLLIIYFGLISLLTITSCRKFVSIPPPPNQVIASTVFSNDNTAISAITGLYSQFMISNSFFLNGGITWLTGLASDELYNVNANSNHDQFFTNSLISTNSINSAYLWNRGYSLIYHANACIEGLENSQSLSAKLKLQLIGEAKFLRALSYFYLVGLYGDAPLILTTDYNSNASMPRSASSEIYKRIVEDLLEAESVLPDITLSEEKIRANKWSAKALLSRIYLYKGDWVNAEKMATEVISSNLFQLNVDLNNVFTLKSSETIFQLYPVLSGVNTAEGFNFIPASTSIRPAYPLQIHLLNSFEVSDNRKESWIKSNIINSVEYHYPYKYKVKFNLVKTEYNIVLRLAEQYLIRAEARVQLNKIEEGRSDLNIIRLRAELPPSITNDKHLLLSEIIHERQVELFAEHGHRWFDLKRTGLIDSILSVEKNNWQPYASVFPIPEDEIQRNPFLNQNPGY